MKHLNLYPNLKSVRQLFKKEFTQGQISTGLKFLSVFVTIQIILTALSGYLLQIFPLASELFVLMLACYGGYLIIPIYLYYRFRLFRKAPQELAVSLDKMNPDAADIFRVSLSLDNHSNRVLDGMNSYYAGFLQNIKLSGIVVSWRFPLLILGATFLWLLSGLVSPHPGSYFRQTLNPWTGLKNVPTLTLKIVADKEIAGAGDTIQVKGELKGYLPGQDLYAYVKTKEQEVRYPVPVENNRVDFPYASDKSFHLFIAGVNGKSNKLKIRVLDKPSISDISAVVYPPRYTRLKPDTLSRGRTHFSVYPGSRVHWQIETSRKTSVVLMTDAGNPHDSKPPVELQGDKNRFFNLERKFTARTRFKKEAPGSGVQLAGLPFKYRFVLTDEFGIKSIPSVFSVVDMKKDERPNLEIIEPDNQSRIDRSEKIPVSLIVNDDFGLVSLKIKYRLTSDGLLKDSSEINITPWLKERVGNYISQIWNLADFDLRPENKIEFYFTLCDNDYVSGPKCSSSDKRTIHYPTIREIMKEVAAEESEALTSLRSASERQKNITKKLKRLKDGLSDQKTRIPAYESRKILINDPGRLKRQNRVMLEKIEMELGRQAPGKEKQGIQRSLKNFKKAAENLNKSIPDQKILNESSVHKLKALDNLLDRHEKLSHALHKLEEDLQNKTRMDSQKWKHQTRSVKNQLEKNLEGQKNLKEYLNSELQQKKLKEKLKKDLLAEQKKSVEDMKQSIEDLESFLEKSSRNELFSEELLEKMQQIQELLKETLPDSLVEMMKKKMEGEQVKAEDVQQSLENLMNNKESFEQNIDRALHQLKRLKEMMKMETWKKELQENAERQKSLKTEIENLKKNASKESRDKLTDRQQSIQKSVKDIAKEMNTSSTLRSAGKKEISPESQKKLMDKMESVKRDLEKSAVGNKSPAAQGAKKAQDQLEGMVQALNSLMSGMKNSSPSIDPYQIQILVYESIKLITLQQLIIQSEKKRRIKGWESKPVTLYSNSLQVARWLYQKLQKLSVELPIVSPYLLTQSRMLVASLEKASTERNHSEARQALGHNQNITRELLKLLKFAKNMPQGSGSGQGGQGNNSEGNMSQSDPSQGKGLSESLKGLSGKQLALNQTTSQLLKSMLQNRKYRKGQGRPGFQGKGSEKGGEGSPQDLANQQGKMSENLESLAESAGSEGGASSKLRKLAQEARSLEKTMRKGKISADLTNSQERFKSRLLETSKALEERGFGSRREGKYSEKPLIDKKSYSGIKKEEWQLLLENEKKRVKKMTINPEERKILSKFFESLLTK